jgi:uncharacterized protein (DUF302 family)
MTGTSESHVVEHPSAFAFEPTMERVVAAIEAAGMTVFSRIDHAAGARAAGLAMPPATVLIYGHAKGGTPIMLAAPLAALDLPLRVLVREDEQGRTLLAFHPVADMLLQAGVPEALATRLAPAQKLLVGAIQA